MLKIHSEFNDDVHNPKTWDVIDSVERAAPTATSLEVVQDSSNIAKTQSTTTPTELISQETSSDGGPWRQETMGVPLFKLDRILALEIDLRQTKKVYGTAYTKLIMKVKKLEKTVKTRQARRRAKIVVSDDDMASEDSSKQGRMIKEIDKDVGVTLVTPTKVSSQEDQPEDQLGVLISTSSGGVSTTSRIVSSAGMIQQVNIIIPSSSATKDKAAIRLQEQLDEEESYRIARDAEGFTEDEWEDIRERVKADEELTQKLQAKERDKYSEVDQARMLSRDRVEPRDRERDEHDKESVKIQKLEENDAEKEELRACLDIVSEDEIAMDFESLATKYPIIDGKTHILTENMMYYQIIRAKGSSKNYKIFSEMLDDFDRQDMVDLHRLVQERYETTSPEGYDLLLWGDLKTLFEPCEEDEVWRNQQGYNLIS
ncbi:hypothetical protein Tco_0661707 [Tanacetum coccineum]